MSYVIELPNNSYKPITDTAWVRARMCKLQKGCTRLAAASDQVYQLLAHGRWFALGTPASPTTKTGRNDIAEILLKVALSTINQSIKSLIDTEMAWLIEWVKLLANTYRLCGLLILGYIERTWLFQNRVVRTKYDIHVVYWLTPNELILSYIMARTGYMVMSALY